MTHDSKATLHVHRYPDARAFLDAHEKALHEREVEYGSMIGHARRLASVDPSDEDSNFYGIETTTGEPVGQAIWVNASRPMTISHLDPDVVPTLVRRLQDDSLTLPGVRGPKETASRFANAWREAVGCEVTVQMEDLLYEARSITLPSSRGGRMIVADEEHRDCARDWLGAFIREALPFERCDPDVIDRQIAYHLEQQRLVLWQNESGENTSMASCVRESDHGGTISLVYTPPSHRSRGYAGCVVGYLSQRILDDGKSFCCLYTNADNPVSNALYPKLGYRMIAEGVHYRFE